MRWGLLGLALTLLWVLSAPADGSPEPVAGATPTGVLTVCSVGPPDCQYSSVQDAVDAASGGDVIKVATGVYTDVHARPAPLDFPYPPANGVLTQVVYISKTLTVRGGYAAPDFADPPNPTTNPTTLDAQDQGRVMLVTSGVSLTVEGLSITQGSANGQGGQQYGGAGAGLYIYAAAVTLTQDTLTENQAGSGGGLYAIDSQVVLSGSDINLNGAGGSGGGLYLRNSDIVLGLSTVDSNHCSDIGAGLYVYAGTAKLVGNTITRNRGSARYAGGLYFSRSEVELDSNLVASNTSSGSAGGLWVGYSEATILGNTIGDNRADDSGGGLLLEHSTVTLDRNLVIANRGGWGGGLCVKESDVTFDQNTIVANSTSNHGGGLRSRNSQLTLRNTVVADNRAGSKGSGLQLIGGSAHFVHTSIARNSGGDGCGILLTEGTATPATAILTNTILAGHAVGICVDAANTAELEATLWGSGTWANQDDWTGPGTILTGTLNVWGDPAFVAPDVRDYHIKPGSAAINAGVNAGLAEDLDGDPRPLGCLYDVGADEAPTVNAPCGLQVTHAITSAGLLTATLAWDPPAGVVTYTLRTALHRIDEASWTQATVVTDSLPGSAGSFTAVVAHHNAPVYFALKSFACGVESPVSGNAFWPRWDVFLPVLLRAW
jgi:hypothetical protein